MLQIQQYKDSDSSGSESDSDSDARRKKRARDEKMKKKNSRKREDEVKRPRRHIALPDGFSSGLKRSTTSSAVDDHGGDDEKDRFYNFELGKWLSVVAIELVPIVTERSGSLFGLKSRESELGEGIAHIVNSKLDRNDICARVEWFSESNLHLSISKMLPLLYHQADLFAKSVKNLLLDRDSVQIIRGPLQPLDGVLTFRGMSLFCNPARTGLFLAANLVKRDERFQIMERQWEWCQQLVSLVDRMVVSKMGLDHDEGRQFEYFRSPKFHVSLGRVEVSSDAIEQRQVLERLFPRKPEGMDDEEDLVMDLDFNQDTMGRHLEQHFRLGALCCRFGSKYIRHSSIMEE